MLRCAMTCGPAQPPVEQRRSLNKTPPLRRGNPSLRQRFELALRFGLVNEVRLLNLTRSTSGAFMNREAIKQKVFDALGIILVDKSVINEDATFSELFLEDEDVESLFTSLEEAFGLTFPGPIKQQAIDNAREFSLHMIVELVVMMGKETLSKEGKDEKRNRKPGRQH
ncbi:hypothetical protein [Pseudomonas syringae]|uniref:hypothetical protein n=1 Tax=Pseudomonas syringae TaxID=317 RepID=UPI000492B9AD|nr:hypothetical protein [Pseudomonas syringae]MDU8431065.1 hypothetical protein [Pseudomonas syringae pv. actinidifoliorum]MDU8521412.1 hypothetical protein [Pseudomonas syringae pv. actinidifoliorum]MDU8526454.1 hypothetical protein [Pseudomonas syringae pv. actinidifoliorum]